MPPANDVVKQCMPDCKKLDQRSDTNTLLVIWISHGPHLSKSDLIGCSKKKHSIKISFEICSSLSVTWLHKYQVCILAKFVSKMFVWKENQLELCTTTYNFELCSVLCNPLYSNFCTFLCTTAQQFECNNTTIFMHHPLRIAFSTKISFFGNVSSCICRHFLCRKRLQS